MAQVRPSKQLRAQGGCHRTATTIGTLPDDVLLEIFDSYRNQSYLRPRLYELYQEENDPYRIVWPWHLLVHVCRQWRQIVFESPLRLNLHILCTHRTPVRKNLSIWPIFPIAISYHPSEGPLGQGNVIDALKRPDRVSHISLDLTGPQWDKMATVMRKPFPVLAHLNVSLDLDYGDAPVIPANFLGGSAPRLQELILSGIPYHALPKALPTLLLPASHLVTLKLLHTPPTGYLSPEAMVASLAALPRLETFIIEFQPATSRRNRIHPLPTTRTILPSLTSFGFRGTSEYLEDLVARIDGPQLDDIFTVVYLNRLVDIQVPQLSEFIDRSVIPESNLFKIARVVFFDYRVAFAVHSHTSSNRRLFWSCIFCNGNYGIDWPVFHIAPVLSQFSAAFSNVGHLKLAAGPKEVEGMDDVEWLHLLRQFSTARTLHVSPNLARHVALALEDITAETVIEVLPSLESICIEGQPASSIEKFITARRVSGRPVTVVDTEMVFNGRRAESYVSKLNFLSW